MWVLTSQILLGTADQTSQPSSRPMTSGEGRKSRNLREATQHLREEALRRYRMKHSGEDPPAEWEPSAAEQEEIIRAVTPPGPIQDEALADLVERMSAAGTPRTSSPMSFTSTPTPRAEEGNERRESMADSLKSCELPVDVVSPVDAVSMSPVRASESITEPGTASKGATSGTANGTKIATPPANASQKTTSEGKPMTAGTLHQSVHQGTSGEGISKLNPHE